MLLEGLVGSVFGRLWGETLDSDTGWRIDEKSCAIIVDAVLLDSNIPRGKRRVSIPSIVEPSRRFCSPGHENAGLEPTLKVGSNWMATALGNLIRLNSIA